MNDPLRPGETLVSATPSQGTCSDSLTCNLGSIASGGSATVTVVANVTATCGDRLVNTATIGGDQFDPNAANNTSSTSALVFCLVAGGTFVIGDRNAAAGTSVTFWGAKWSKLTSLSGGAAPAAFTGAGRTASVVHGGDRRVRTDDLGRHGSHGRRPDEPRLCAEPGPCRYGDGDRPDLLAKPVI